ncbi:hypothetical protein cypCar_00027429 [Cyprinus carpio]|nr:hypothetical protein cypCar_00027429 [Cyprinus carpio]
MALFNIAQSSYEYLNCYLLEKKDPNPIIGHAKSFPFIFIEDHFVNVRSVARSEEFEQKPYLYVLPVIFSKFERLWDCIGVKNQFTEEQFVAALEEMKALYGSHPLSMSDLHNCVAILMNGLYKIKEEKLTNCLIPDESGVLTSSKELRFNDSPWMPVSAGVKLSHELIPRPGACHFGVMTTRHHTLKNHFVSEFSLHAKEFGQTEKLSVRIKKLIDAYPSKKDILKELIQNADDAEATEIHFVWDKRKHMTEKIFGEKWELVQGPALCVYNNRTFSDADLQGIQQLGEGGKHGTLGRTGKYGLGFNSVYHLTDCPSILTGDKWLCISDPNLKYVEGVTKQSPGCMFSMEDEFKKSFEDVYHTFLPEMFDLNSGTMFRLPLRTEQMAEKSEISRHTVTDRDMEELYYALKGDPEGLILFLKHITKIQFSEITEDGKQPKYPFLIEKKYKEESSMIHKNCLTTSSLLVLGQLLLCDNMEDVEKTLANHDIHNSGHKEDGHGSLPKPGCCIPEEWHDCLDMNFLNNFESGEYVGFSKDNSGEYFYAIVIERVDDQIRQFPASYKIRVGSDDFTEYYSGENEPAGERLKKYKDSKCPGTGEGVSDELVELLREDIKLQRKTEERRAQERETEERRAQERKTEERRAQESSERRAQESRERRARERETEERRAQERETEERRARERETEERRARESSERRAQERT